MSTSIAAIALNDPVLSIWAVQFVMLESEVSCERHQVNLIFA
jgi:hypothetical protein